MKAEGRSHVSIIITSEEEWISSVYFNPNAYPDFLKEILTSCEERLALMLYYAGLIESQMPRDIDNFLDQLNRLMYTGGLPDVPQFIAYYRGMTYIASLHGMLYSLKSFLDVLGILWTSLIVGKRTKLLFNRSKVKGEEIAGGRLINWLRETVGSKFKNASRLASIIEDNSRRWISKAVKYRNDLTHYGEIKGLKHLRVKLRKDKRRYGYEDILMPEMPDGTPVRDYCKMLIKNTCSFVVAGLKLFPSVDMALLNLKASI